MKRKWRVLMLEVGAAMLVVQPALGGVVAQDWSPGGHGENGDSSGAGDQGDDGPQGSCQVVDGTPYPCELN